MTQHVFVNYIASDYLYARQLMDFLLAKGFNIWRNDCTDESSETWESIAKGIEQAAAYIFIMSREAQTSQPLIRAIGLANQHKKPLFPVLISGEKWTLFLSTHVEDMRQGQLPSATFIERLAQHMTPQPGSAKDVTQNSTPEAPPTDSPAMTSIGRPAALRQLTDALRFTMDQKDETLPKNPAKTPSKPDEK